MFLLLLFLLLLFHGLEDCTRLSVKDEIVREMNHLLLLSTYFNTDDNH